MFREKKMTDYFHFKVFINYKMNKVYKQFTMKINNCLQKVPSTEKKTEQETFQS